FSGYSDDLTLWLHTARLADTFISAACDLHDTPDVLVYIQVHDGLHRRNAMIRCRFTMPERIQLLKAEFQLLSQFAPKFFHTGLIVLPAIATADVVYVADVTHGTVTRRR